MSGDFRFGDAKARDDMGGCCGKPVGCNNPSKGCVHKPEKADWKKKAKAEKERPGCLGTDAVPCTPDFTCVVCVARELGVPAPGESEQ